MSPIYKVSDGFGHVANVYLLSDGIYRVEFWEHGIHDADTDYLTEDETEAYTKANEVTQED